MVELLSHAEVPARLSVTVAHNVMADLVAVRVVGTLDRTEQDRLAVAVERALAAAPSVVVLDLSRARPADSAALTGVLDLRRRADAACVAAAVVAHQSWLVRRLRTLAPAMPRYRTPAEATAAAAAGALQPRRLCQRVPGGARLRDEVRNLAGLACLRWGLEPFVDHALRLTDRLVSAVQAQPARAVDVTIADGPRWVLLVLRPVEPADTARPAALPGPQRWSAAPPPAPFAVGRAAVGQSGGRVWAALRKRPADPFGYARAARVVGRGQRRSIRGGPMPNVQQPEMRRSGKDPLVQDSAANITEGQRGAGGHSEHRSVPPDQQSPYGPGGEEPDRDDEQQ